MHNHFTIRGWAEHPSLGYILLRDTYHLHFNGGLWVEEDKAIAAIVQELHAAGRHVTVDMVETEE